MQSSLFQRQLESNSLKILPAPEASGIYPLTIPQPHLLGGASLVGSIHRKLTIRKRQARHYKQLSGTRSLTS